MKVYHGSTRKDLTLLTPQPTKSHDKYIGDYLFATTNYKLALMYLVPLGIPTLMDPDKQPNIVIGCTYEAFKKVDAGGAVYDLPADDFEESPQKELSDYELVNTRPVRPQGKNVYENTIDALQDAGIEIRFVTPDRFNMLLNTPHRLRRIQEIPSY